MAAGNPVRVAADLYEAAERQGAAENRTAEEQIDHWVRLGLKLTSRDTVTGRRVEAALTGQLAWSELSPAERHVADTELDIAIETAAHRVAFGAEAVASGGVAVALDTDGTVREYLSDGSSRPPRIPSSELAITREAEEEP